MVIFSQTPNPGPDAMLRAFSASFEKRRITPDASQTAAAQRLQRLFDELMALKHARRTQLRKLLIHPELPRGVYLWGGVGRGKSLLLNCFFETLPYRRKRRVHFHAFMRDIHERLHAPHDEEDPIATIAADIARETRLLCLDEFHVSDIADAMILGRLIEAMTEEGVIMLVTSNYAPDNLYPNGLQRQYFLPAIEFIKENLDVLEVEGGFDYRLRTLETRPVYITPANQEAEATMNKVFFDLSAGEGHTQPLMLLGREVPVRRRALGVVWFDFAELCGGPRSQNDYLDIARRYPTVLVSNIPRMDPSRASEARRFTWLVDVLYDHSVKLIATAAAPPEALYAEGLQAKEFSRTVSRLIEMQTREYLTAPHMTERTQK